VVFFGGRLFINRFWNGYVNTLFNRRSNVSRNNLNRYNVRVNTYPTYEIDDVLSTSTTTTIIIIIIISKYGATVKNGNFITLEIL